MESKKPIVEAIRHLLDLGEAASSPIEADEFNDKSMPDPEFVEIWADVLRSLERHMSTSPEFIKMVKWLGGKSL